MGTACTSTLSPMYGSTAPCHSAPLSEQVIPMGSSCVTVSAATHEDVELMQMPLASAADLTKERIYTWAYQKSSSGRATILRARSQCCEVQTCDVCNEHPDDYLADMPGKEQIVADEGGAFRIQSIASSAGTERSQYSENQADLVVTPRDSLIHKSHIAELLQKIKGVNDELNGPRRFDCSAVRESELRDHLQTLQRSYHLLSRVEKREKTSWYRKT